MVMDRAYHREYSKQYYHNRRAQLLAMLGNKCVQCGTEKKLQFDHIQSEDKEFSVGKLLNFAFKDILDEVRKCQLLCFDCHIQKSRKEGAFTKGEKRHYKLSKEQVEELYKEYKIGVSLRELSIRYQVARNTITSAFARFGF